MNIYEKLDKVRQELAGMSIKKSGKNKFAGYSYYELGDFLPIVQKLCSQNKLLTVVTFTAELAEMVIVDMEKSADRISFTSPFGSADLKGCHLVQNIGAVETYQRRYLYQTAFEIVEHDALDATTGKAEKKSDHREENPAADYATKEQCDTLRQLAADFGDGTKECKRLLAYADDIKLTSAKADDTIHKAEAVLTGRQG